MAQNNDFKAIGTVMTEPQFDYECYSEEYFVFYMKVKRISGVFDIFCCRASRKLTENIECGKEIEIYGEVRTFNEFIGEKFKLHIFVWVKEVYTPAPEALNDNSVRLSGFVCKPPIIRKTPLGKQICDVLLAVNRPYGKSDYIPCIFWGGSAKNIAELTVGSELSLRGRLQSREYEKDGKIHTAYEVSAWKYGKEI